MDAVILAGGRGTRLAPYNTVFPKPLVPLGDRPILDTLIHQLDHRGFDCITLCLGYLGELIRAYFHNGSPGVRHAQLRFIQEDHALGTVGALKLLPRQTSAFLVMNGDVLTTMDYAKLVEYHQTMKAELTIAMHPKTVQLELGVLQVDGGNRLEQFVEKPTFSYLVSMGVYVYDPSVLDYIGTGEYLDFPDLVQRMLRDGRRVVGCRSEDYWLDLGSHADYGKAQDEFETMRPLLLRE